METENKRASQDSSENEQDSFLNYLQQKKNLIRCFDDVRQPDLCASAGNDGNNDPIIQHPDKAKKRRKSSRSRSKVNSKESQQILLDKSYQLLALLGIDSRQHISDNQTLPSVDLLAILHANLSVKLCDFEEEIENLKSENQKLNDVVVGESERNQHLTTELYNSKQTCSELERKLLKIDYQRKLAENDRDLTTAIEIGCENDENPSLLNVVEKEEIEEEEDTKCSENVRKEIQLFLQKSVGVNWKMCYERVRKQLKAKNAKLEQLQIDYEAAKVKLEKLGCDGGDLRTRLSRKGAYHHDSQNSIEVEDLKNRNKQVMDKLSESQTKLMESEDWNKKLEEQLRCEKKQWSSVVLDQSEQIRKLQEIQEKRSKFSGKIKGAMLEHVQKLKADLERRSFENAELDDKIEKWNIQVSIQHQELANKQQEIDLIKLEKENELENMKFQYDILLNEQEGAVRNYQRKIDDKNRSIDRLRSDISRLKAAVDEKKESSTTFVKELQEKLRQESENCRDLNNRYQNQKIEHRKEIEAEKALVIELQREIHNLLHRQHLCCCQKFSGIKSAQNNFKTDSNSTPTGSYHQALLFGNSNNSDGFDTGCNCNQIAGGYIDSGYPSPAGLSEFDGNEPYIINHPLPLFDASEPFSGHR